MMAIAWFSPLINLLLGITAVAYPLIWLWQSNSHLLSILPWLLALLWGIKAISAVGFQRVFALFMTAFLLIVAFTRTLQTMYWYPVIINLVMLILFASSLLSSQSLVERFARLQTPDLPPKAIRYTRKVTQVWCGFFVFNIVVTANLIWLEQYHYWAIYSGVIAYVLMGLLFIGEWVVRQYVKDK
ncbi:hypothetical protein [Rodentibacter abscessus]|uniref:COG4648 family protein n=1 Tax=Rodentibacter abscessus TaxID=3381777 RepID=UPI00399C5EFF